MVNEITQSSRGNSNNVIPSEARNLAQALKFTHRNSCDQASNVRFLAVFAARNDKMKLRHLRHALPIQPDFANAFDAREDVINGLTAETHQFRADDAGDEITREIENLLWR